VNLSELVAGISLERRPARGSDPVVCGLAIDSRQVEAGSLFAALPGSRQHGSAFVSQAVERGAVAVLSDVWVDPGVADVVLLRSEEPARVMGELAARM
jgi:UDP-N-acetylmuramoyl-L-alanyl-D-glutamate--2,6-diaminopimelate ligase